MTIPKTFSAADIIDKGGVNRQDLARYILNHGLPAYFLNSLKRVDAEYQIWLLKRAQIRDNIDSTFMDEFDHPEEGIYCREDDLITFEHNNPRSINLKKLFSSQEEAPQKIEETAEAETKQNKTGNFFIKKNNGHWHIGFGEERVDNVDHKEGFRIIACLLREKPGTSISCKDFYEPALERTMSESEAINQGLLETKFKKQSTGSGAERKIALGKYEELEEELLTAGIEEKEEIQEKMEKLRPYLNLKERNFADPNAKKAQTNVIKRLDTAYNALRDANMKNLAKHLQDNIKPDGKYGLCYSAANTWEITDK